MPGFWNRLRFNLWYYQRPPWDTGISPPELFFFIDNHPAGRALDLGCGTGTNVITLMKSGWQVTGVDFAGHAISRARRKAQRAEVNPTFIQGDVTDLKGITGPFDLILDIGCYHAIQPTLRGAYQASILRLLAPGGSYLVYGFLGKEGSDWGIRPEDIRAFEGFLHLEERTDSHDPNGHPSTWLHLACTA